MQVFSLGEVGGVGKLLRAREDVDGDLPLHKLHQSTSSQNDGEDGVSNSNNTLSNIPSLGEDLDYGRGKKVGHRARMTSSPLQESKPDASKLTSRLKKTKKSRSYRVKFPLDATAIWNKSTEGIPADYSDGSAGEVPVIIRSGWGRIQGNTSNAGSVGTLNDSVSQLRDGIDVIDISSSERKGGTESASTDLVEFHRSAEERLLPRLPPLNKMVDTTPTVRETAITPSLGQREDSYESVTSNSISSSLDTISANVNSTVETESLGNHSPLQVKRYHLNKPNTPVKMQENGLSPLIPQDRVMDVETSPSVQDHTTAVSGDIHLIPSLQETRNGSSPSGIEEEGVSSLKSRDHSGASLLGHQKEDSADSTVSSIPEDIEETSSGTDSSTYNIN